MQINSLILCKFGCMHIERGQPPKRTEAPSPPPISRSPTLRLVPPSLPQKHPLPLPAQIAWN